MTLSFTPIFRAAGLALLASLALAAGCKSTLHTLNSKHDTTVGPKHAVTNVYEQETWPAHLRRIALLPLHKGRYAHIGMEQIEENFAQELGKRRVFELVVVEPQRMQQLFAQESFSSVEPLPTRLLAKLHEIYAIDGVMLVDVTYFDAYQPVGLGIRAKLLDGHSGELVWSVDETFDGSDPAVSNAARKYFKTQSVNTYPLQGSRNVLQSPARFSKYVAAAVFETLM